MSTARDFINLGLKEAGVLGVGQTALAEDISDCFVLLQRMLNNWQKQRYIVPMLIEVVGLGNNLRSNKIGPGQYYNHPRPNEINAAVVVQLYTNTNPVRLPLTRIFSYEDYLNKISIPSLNSLPNYYYYDAAFPYGNVYLWPVPSPQYEIHFLVKGQIGFNTEISSGEIVAGGTGYVDGNYVAVPLVNIDGTGTGANADFTVAGGIVTVVTLNDPGDGYVINNFMIVDNANLGRTGADFSWKVTNVVGSLDSEFNMPEEYEEAIHYNLTMRISSMYQMPITADQRRLAKASLNTIKVANTQISELVMPSTLSRGRAFNLWNADGY